MQIIWSVGPPWAASILTSHLTHGDGDVLMMQIIWSVGSPPAASKLTSHLPHDHHDAHDQDNDVVHAS